MPKQPEGAPLVDGVLPAAVAAPAPLTSASAPAGTTTSTANATGNPTRERPFSLYLHVPYCRVRCGYCDFNTYTNLGMGPGANLGDYPATIAAEAKLAAQAMAQAGLRTRPVQTIFVGGGTPTMLPAVELVSLLATVRETWELADGVEITTEANPDTVDERYLAALAEGGFTRVSFGMQSAVPHVLRTLDRTHTPERVPQVVEWARAHGLSSSLDLIYGTPGETLADWQTSLDAAVAMNPDHISAYALVIEEGTRMHTQVTRGELPQPTDDDEAAKYELADAVLAQAGYEWYEISNWSRPGNQCQHNRAYWQDYDWWGLGPGAHSHLGDARLWNTKHPLRWAAQIASGQLPVAGHEVIVPENRELERIMLGIRLREGLPLASLGESWGEPETPAGRTPSALVPVVGQLLSQGLLEPAPALRGQAILTLKGRLLADTVTRALARI